MEKEGEPKPGSTLSIVVRTASSAKGPRPQQGARLLALRQAAGLTQVELGKAVGVRHSSIALWEWSERPPRAEILHALARVLNVTIEELIAGSSTHRRPQRSAPVSEMQRAFDAARKLPRKQQRKLVEVVNALVREYGSSDRAT